MSLLLRPLVWALLAALGAALATPMQRQQAFSSRSYVVEDDQRPAGSSYAVFGGEPPGEYVGGPYIVPVEGVAYEGPPPPLYGGAHGGVFYGPHAPLVSADWRSGQGGHRGYYGDSKGGGYFGGDEVYGAKEAVGGNGYYGGGGGGKGESGHHTYSGFGGGREAGHAGKADVGFYGGSSGLKKGHEDAGAFHGGQSFGTSGRAATSAGNKGDHKKGHHVSGFHNTYHKDESGKNSRYYDDSDDQGGHFAVNAEDKGFGYNGGESYKGGRVDSAYDEGDRGSAGRTGGGFAAQQERGDGGNYGSGGSYGRKTGFGQSKGGREFYDTGNKFSRGGGQVYEGGGGFGGGNAGFYGGHGGTGYVGY